MNLSKRGEIVRQSEIRSMSIECDECGGLNLSQGICDLPLPAEVAVAAQRAIREGENSYTRYDGISELRGEVANKYRKFYSLDVDAVNHVVISAGSTGAFYSACMALLDPGDEVVLFEPYYGYHLSTIQATGLQARYVRMEPPTWSFTRGSLENAITPRTRGIMVCTPSNPSGKVYSEHEICLILEVAEKHDLFVFTDEIYEHFVYGSGRHVPPLAVAADNRRVVTISGVSKIFSVTGWRVGYSVTHPDWTTMIGYFNDLIYVCAPAPLQRGVAVGLRDLPMSFYEGVRATYEKKRDRICAALSASRMTPHIPAGAYYVLADIERLPGRGSKEKIMNLLDRSGVAAVPGCAFYHDDAGENLARFCFAKDDAILDEACRRIERFGKKL